MKKRQERKAARPEKESAGAPPSPLPRPPAGQRVPVQWRGEIQRILISRAQIASRIAGLAARIEQDFKGRELVVVAVLNGTVLFLADLIRHLSLPLRLDFIGVSSYGPGTTSGELIFTKELRLDVRGRDVLLVDDILDTGRTLKRVLARLRELGPRRIKICVLLEKKARRIEKVRADYTGFSIPDFFVVGYGLDFAERYRNLPFLGVLHPHLYESRQPSSPRPSPPSAGGEGEATDNFRIHHPAVARRLPAVPTAWRAS